MRNLLRGRHEPEGPEAIAYLPEGFRRVTEDVQHAVCSLRGGGLKTLRDTAAPLGFSELVARRRGSSIEDA